MKTTSFHRRGLWILIGVATLSFGFLIALAVVGDEALGVRSVNADSYSYSALGHRALLELMEQRDVPTVVSRFDSGHRAGEDALLVLAEPRVTEESRRQAWLEQNLNGGGDVLLILPKHEPRALHHRSTRWIGDYQTVSTDECEKLLEMCGLQTDVQRVAGSPGWSGNDGLKPDLGAAQLVQSFALTPSIECTDGLLLGYHEREDSRLWVLSDPDLIANHGIGRGDNAALAVLILDRVREGRSLVFDEELHGNRAEPSVWRALLRFPLSLVTMQVFLAACVMAFAGLRRFGPPRTIDSDEPAGKEALIRNTAELLGMGDRTPHVVSEYFQQTLNDLRRELRAPATRNTLELCEWLKRRSERRSRVHDVPAMHEQVRAQVEDGRRSPAAALDLARRIHAMKQDFLHGP